MARRITWAQARIDSHIARRDPVPGRPQLGDATVLVVKHSSAGPLGDGMVVDHPLVRRRVAVLLDRRKDFLEWRRLHDSGLLRLVREQLLRRGTTAWFELDESCDPSVLLFGRQFSYESERDDPGVHTAGFESISCLLGHLLKHPGGLGRAPAARAAARARWLPLLGGTRDQEEWLGAIARGGCPAQEVHEAVPMTEASGDVCAGCDVRRRTRCLGLALDAAEQYAAIAIGHLASVTEPPNARHVHYGTAGGATVVAGLSDGQVEVVLRGERRGSEPVPLATCFQAGQDYEEPMETQARRRLRHALDARHTLKLCTEGGWRKPGAVQ